MKRKTAFALCLFLVLGVSAPGLRSTARAETASGTPPLPPRVEEAMEQRGQKIVAQKEALIQSTLAAYGGEYRRDGDRARVTICGKTYDDFEVQIVRSKYLLLRVPDGILQFEIVK